MIENFDEQYLYFAEKYLTAERTRADCDLIENACGLRKGDRVLDVGCGHGRISNELASRGYKVIGIDINEFALEVAVKQARVLGLAVEYIKMDFFNIDKLEKFDCALSWYTSFGYSDDRACRGQLRSIYASLKKGGRFVLDHINRDRCLKSLPPASVHDRGDDFMIDFFNYDVEGGRLFVDRRYSKEGVVTSSPYSIRLLTYPELKDWMEYSGFKDVAGYDSNGMQYGLESSRMVVVGVK
ncbi:methyltransferase domain-containing protein [Pseudomonas sp. LS1212]|uniref:class I SAM-dependent methyltransferase n=1 Tax=Pseudomonas sp. LS1212 TaxID=2972478 RepID=UPI00215C3E78|nr:class I SAM-dependent methyltransferase [Pseudomonas sp. LS1212]UVJ42372.1 methyltransferase domain-containing protein [Pseudomonas sp. LS1212]